MLAPNPAPATPLPSPLEGEGGSARSNETDEGFVAAIAVTSCHRKPLTRLAARATLSLKGRGVRSSLSQDLRPPH
jgi:hypothetical protein